MNRTLKFFALACLALASWGCESRTDKTDGGGVLLSISDFDGLPISVSASGSGDLAQIGQVTLQNIAKDPNGVTSSLMNVEIESYEVTYTRADRGTRIPPKLVNYIFGVAPVNGTYTLDNGPFMRADQFRTVPIKDLVDFGIDTETGSDVIRLTVGIRFFGRTLSGDPVDSAPAYFTLDVVP